jgi:hypothetical protein
MGLLHVTSDEVGNRHQFEQWLPPESCQVVLETSGTHAKGTPVVSRLWGPQ